MPGWNETALFATLSGVALKSTAVLGAAWLVVLVLRGRSAAARHLVWTAAAGALLALPILSVSLPPLPVPGALASEASALFRTTSVIRPDISGSWPAPTIHAASMPRATPWHLHWRLSLILLWAAGSLGALSQMLIAFARMRNVRRAAERSPHHAAAARLSGELGIRHAVDVLETASGAMPMTFGIRRPVVLLPRDASAWSDERRHVVLLHELVHVRRGDVAAQLIARLALILHWWNPLAWTAWREFLGERERATDDLVLRAGARPSDYAGHLLDIARNMQLGPTRGWTAVAMARRSQLEGRLRAILNSRVNRKPAGRPAAVAAVLAAISVIVPLAALHAQQSTPATIPPDVDATIRAALAQKNSEMVEKPAAAFADLQQYDVARKLLDSAVAIHEQVSGAQSDDYGKGLLKLGDLERKRNRVSEAESFYTKAVGVLGDRAETAHAILYLGVLALGRNSPAAATDDFQRAQSLDPSLTGRARMWTALVYERADNAVDAEAMYRSALAVEAPDSADAAATSSLLARFLEKQGRVDEAKNLSQRVTAVRTVSARQPGANVVSVGNATTPPKVLSKIDPVYPAEARTAAWSEGIVLQLEVGADGAAHNIQVIKGAGFGLDESAVAAVSQWRFQPATKNDAPVTVRATIEVNFRLL